MLIRNTRGNVPPRLTHCPYCGDRLVMGVCASCEASDPDRLDSAINGPIEIISMQSRPGPEDARSARPLCAQDP